MRLFLIRQGNVQVYDGLDEKMFGLSISTLLFSDKEF